MGQARLIVPARIAAGEVVMVRLLIQHEMETGYRQDLNGRLIPRNVIRRVRCELGGVEVFSAEPSSGISANPLFEFPVRVRAAGEWRVTWEDDQGVQGELRQALTLG
jgi:sulfur-oxidizing protein SoxZ